MLEKTIRAQVQSISPLTENIARVILAPEEFVPYQAGQYLQILFAGEALNYSIANAPLGSQQYELHIRHNLCNHPLLVHMQEQGSVVLRLPFGVCHTNQLEKDRPIIFLAGGTGFAPVKAMIEQLLASTDPCIASRPFELFWGARSQNALYLEQTLRLWEAKAAHFRYFPFLAETNQESLVSTLFAKHPKGLKEWQIVISGPFDMVYSTRDALLQHGVLEQHLFSDAFAFELK